MKPTRFQLCLLCLALLSAVCLALGGPAVRIGDSSDHGGIVISGGAIDLLTTNVYVNAKHIVAVGAGHTCPQVTGLVPHVGGPIVTGSTRVFVGGVPVALDGSSAVCVGPSDTIVGGSPDVFINE